MKKETNDAIRNWMLKVVGATPSITCHELVARLKSELNITLTTDAIIARRKRYKLPGEGRKYTKTIFSEELTKKGFDGDNWSHGWLKSDTASIFIRNKDGVMDYMQIRDELVDEMREYAPKYPTIKRTKLGSHLLVVDPADVHFGKLSVFDETHETYNLEVARQRFERGIDELITKASMFDIHSVVLVVGNDILHVDNPKRTTTSGTPQDTDGMWWEAYNVAKRCYISAVERLLTLGDVKLVFCPSNHDFMSGFMLTDSIVSWFCKNKNVTAHASMTHRKYLKYGNNLLGFTHGDGAKNSDLPNLMMTEVRGTDYKYGYWLIHHGHHKDKFIKRAGHKKSERMEEDKLLITEIQTGMKVDPQNSISVEMVRTPSSADRWHDTNGYKNVQAMEVFLFHASGGQVARLTHHF